MLGEMYTASVNVRDVDAAKDFYVNTLGFELTADDSFPDGFRWVAVRPVGTTTALALNHNPDATPDPIGTGITYTAKDIDKFYETFSAKGVVFDGPPQVMPWGAKGLVFADLDGNKFFVGE
jgi:catechol 2,3-dioxygenase-like lactoylglutathione lyase family enzyme